MKVSSIHRLLMTQFLSALADNMILMATIFVITERALGNVYVGIVQASFFVAYILLAPYAGVLSERIPKANILWLGNMIKLVGAVLLLCGLNPALSYAMIGVGACIYGPGKYAILRELTDNPQSLYKANGLVEGSTIVSILLGTVLGGFLTTVSFHLSVAVIIGCYLLSFFFAWILPRGGTTNVSYDRAWRDFGIDINVLIRNPQAKSSLMGSSSFWMMSSVLRLAMLAWIPIALNLQGTDKASIFMGISAIGIMFGAILSPKVIPLAKLSRLTYVGAGMAVAVCGVCFVPNMYVTAIILFLAGFLGGSYVIPLNTILQNEGDSVGSGKVIAIQNFCENVFMLTGTLLYTGALKIGMGIPFILVFFSMVFLLVALYVRRSFVKS
ncbi:LPLT family lysophospholipid transporter-like MFS transporter [Paenibacillus sp. 1182]|uniref:lysophospholipid transporter LplT n=1 Tax=Paenibacillus sp. 1182 TaxID=2806565 RepID=UPI001AE6118D|nr:lysophospholipid transporter LplT [Paenibacillus sp. 1182]MBP1309156.1 LPLT family lysophospholipid transporter-like MFS transporter [Paenibacillus sp. 1182]